MIGVAKGLLLCLAITFFAVTLSGRARDAVLASRSGYYIARGLHRADHIAPPELQEMLDPYIRQLEQGLDPRIPSQNTAIDAAAGRLPIPGGGVPNDRADQAGGATSL